MSTMNHYLEADPVKQFIQTDMRSDIEDTIVEMYRSTKTFARIMFPEHFYREFDEPYSQVFDAYDNPSIMKCLIKGPRGVGKSSVGGLVFPAKRILFQESHFIVPTSATTTLAVDQSETLKHEIMNNPQVKTFFPGIEILTDSKEQWIIQHSNGYPQLIRPRGAGQQVRGQKFRKWRPDFLLPDDLEKKEEALSDEQREKLKAWFYSDYVLSVNKDNADWRIFYLGTVLHADSLLEELFEDPSWEGITLPLCDEKFNSNFPNYIPTEDIVDVDGKVTQGTKSLAQEYRDKGRIDTFFMEYMCEPQSSEDALFQESMFKSWGSDDKDDIKCTLNELLDSSNTEAVIIVDPAKTVTGTSDETAIVGVVVDYKRHKLFVVDVIHGRFHPNEQYDHIFDMVERLRARVVGIEVTSLNEFITYPFKNEMARRNVNIQLVELQARGGHGTGKGQGKLRRIAALGPYYRRGEVYHNRTACGALEIQLLGFPMSKKKDVMDAFAYIVEMLEKGMRYFFHDWFDEEGTYEEEGKHIEDEYRELDIYDDEAFQFVPIVGNPLGN